MSLKRACVEISGKQFIVEEGQKLIVPYFKNSGSGDGKFRVLAVFENDKVTLGKPILPGASVDYSVEKEIKGKKIIAFKFAKRKGYKKKIGYRQRFLVIQINKLEV